MPATQQRALVEDYCLGCHNYIDNAGGIEFEVLDLAQPQIQPEVVEKMLRKVRGGMMPPAGERRPEDATLAGFATALENTLDARVHPHLVAPKLHRLNRVEYGNAVRDLLALDIDPAEFLPTDDASRGFDNQAGTLTLSPALLEAYLTAARKLSQLAMGTGTSPTQQMYRVAEDTSQNYHVAGLPFGTRGGLTVEHNFPADGNYTLKVFSVNLGNMGNFRPFGEIRGEQLLMLLDGKVVAQIDWDEALGVGLPFDAEGAGQLRTIDTTLPVTAGPHRIGVTFLATNYAPGLDLNNDFERSTIETGGLPGYTFYPHIGSLRVDGPADATPAATTPSRDRLLVCQPGKRASASSERNCAKKVIDAFAHRAYRGLDTAADRDTLLEFYDLGRQDGDFIAGIQMMVQRTLADPKFIYRVESTPDDIAADAAYRITDHELASRLSFFLWSSLPDDELLARADDGTLHQPEVLEAQTTRMLADPRARALTDNFAGQWLALRNLQGHAPVVDQFPDFDDNLRRAFRTETSMFFHSLLTENRPITDLLTADYTFVDERLAKHYGIPNVRGSHFRRVKLEGAQLARQGLLGKGSILTVSSQPGRTSPVIRGNWILSNVLGVPPPPPPPDVPALEPPEGDAAGNARLPSMRTQMEMHRDNPACIGCHSLMDPIGFALEPFDAIGRWRTEDAGNVIDASSVMYDGTPIDGPEGLRQFLLKYRIQFLRNVSEKLLTYALGRGMEYYDMPLVREIVRQTAADDYRLPAFIHAIVASDAFQMNQRTEEDRGEAIGHRNGESIETAMRDSP
ncbi:MAG: DUF1592 domain-containing protein [Gammaproteobacteria bacterium]|nr:DUF1592 domain-containing protein [Gammaproteobacteria bacterium]